MPVTYMPPKADTDTIAPGSLLTFMLPAHPEINSIAHEVQVVIGDLLHAEPNIIGDWLHADQEGTKNKVLTTCADHSTEPATIDEALQRVLSRYAARGAVWSYGPTRRVYTEAWAL